MDKLETGVGIIDSFLEGGLETDTITTIYGASGSGKTCLALVIAASIIKKYRKKVIFIDTEGVSVERLVQISNGSRLFDEILFLKPTTFEEQKNVFEKLKKLVNNKVGLVIVDTIAMLYRLELGKTKDPYEANRELGLQLSFLTEVARKENIPVIIINQVYSGFDNSEKISMVGGDLLKYTSKCLIELVKLNNCTKAVLRKHRSIKEGKDMSFKIVQTGIE